MDSTVASGVHKGASNKALSTFEKNGWNLINSVAAPPAPPAPSPPPNDNFASAEVVVGCLGTIVGTNVGATREPLEPNHAPDNGGGNRSVWYRWQAPATSSVTFTTAGSSYDTVLAVYTGSNVGSLSSLA